MISGWGDFSNKFKVFYPENLDEISKKITTSDASYIARGNGRAYGEAAINKELQFLCLNLIK